MSYYCIGTYLRHGFFARIHVRRLYRELHRFLPHKSSSVSARTAYIQPCESCIEESPPNGLVSVIIGSSVMKSENDVSFIMERSYIPIGFHCFLPRNRDRFSNSIYTVDGLLLSFKIENWSVSVSDDNGLILVPYPFCTNSFDLLSEQDV